MVVYKTATLATEYGGIEIGGPSERGRIQHSGLVFRAARRWPS